MLIVDDHQVVRRGLRTFLELQGDIEVAGEAGDGLAGVELASRLEPDVVLMDIVMPRLDGIGRPAHQGAGARHQCDRADQLRRGRQVLPGA